MAFTRTKGYDEVELKSVVLANSVTVSVGDVIRPGDTTQAPYAIPAQNATNSSQWTGINLGVVQSITNTGKPSELNTVTTASTNQTTKLYSVEYIPCRLDVEYIADLSADAGTTTGSDTYMAQFYLGYTTSGHYNSTLGQANGQLDESSVAVFSTQLHFFSYGQYTKGNINATTGKYTQVAGYFEFTKVV